MLSQLLNNGHREIHSSRMKMGRWSEMRVVVIDHSESMELCGVVIERSGEAWLALEESRVGESVLSRSHLISYSNSILAND